jgi:hypothetical protein
MSARRRTPTYALDEVRRVIKLARIGDRVLLRTQADCGEDSLSRVAALIRRLVASLSPDDFAYAEEQEYEIPIWADIYAVDSRQGVWFIKFYMEHGRVTVTSCHAPKEDIKRVDGKIIKAP